MTKDENSESNAADLVRERDTKDGCTDGAVCATSSGPLCKSPQVCKDVWRLAVCV